MMGMKNSSLLSTQLDNCWHWRGGRAGAEKGCMPKSWELDIEIFFVVVYLLGMSRSRVMALDVDEWDWIEKNIG